MKNEKNTKRTLSVHLILMVLVIGTLIAQVFHRNFFNAFLCVLTLLLFHIPTLVDRRLNIKLPSFMQIMILLFVFSAEILGEIQSFYTIIPHWDTMLHIINGFLMAAIGFSMIDILNNSPKFHFYMSPYFVAFVSFCFSMTIGVLWEFFEFGMDQFFHTDMQKDFFVNQISSVSLNASGLNNVVSIPNIVSTTVTYMKGGQKLSYVIGNGYLDLGIIDTMKDLFVNFIGAISFSLIGMIYIKTRGENKVAEVFIPQLKTQAEIDETDRKREEIRTKAREKRKKKK